MSASPRGRTTGGRCAPLGRWCSEDVVHGLQIQWQIPGNPTLHQSHLAVCLVVLKLVNETCTLVLVVVDGSVAGWSHTHLHQRRCLQDQRRNQWQWLASLGCQFIVCSCKQHSASSSSHQCPQWLYPRLVTDKQCVRRPRGQCLASSLPAAAAADEMMQHGQQKSMVYFIYRMLRKNTIPSQAIKIQLFDNLKYLLFLFSLEHSQNSLCVCDSQTHISDMCLWRTNIV